MKKYEKPFARNLGELLVVQGDCINGSNATVGGMGVNCKFGGGIAGGSGKCDNGNVAAGECKWGSLASKGTCLNGTSNN